MTIAGKIHIEKDVTQGTDEWFSLRRGIVTASEMENIYTKTKKPKARNAYFYKKLQELVSDIRSPEPYVSADMERGHIEEELARELYEKTSNVNVDQVGFITREFNFCGNSFKIGASPDGLVGLKGGIEIKSKAPHLQVEVIEKGIVPEKHILQIQTFLLVSGRSWCDFVSYSGGLPMFIREVEPDHELHEKIIQKTYDFYQDLEKAVDQYHTNQKFYAQQMTKPTDHVIEII